MSDTSYSVPQGSRFPAKIHFLLAGVESSLHFNKTLYNDFLTYRCNTNYNID